MFGVEDGGSTCGEGVSSLSLLIVFLLPPVFTMGSLAGLLKKGVVVWMETMLGLLTMTSKQPNRASLQQVSQVAQLTADNLVSIGSSLSHVHVPGRGIDETGADELGPSEIEIGMGIHNEPGSERRTTDLPGLVKTMLAHCLDASDADRHFIDISADRDQVVLLVNNLGGVSVLELGGITNEVVEQLANDWDIKPVRVLAGTFMTSLNGMGFSISLLKVTDTGLGAGASMIELLDAPSEAAGWSAVVKTETWSDQEEPMQRQNTNIDETWTSNLRSESVFVELENMFFWCADLLSS